MKFLLLDSQIQDITQLIMYHCSCCTNCKQTSLQADSFLKPLHAIFPLLSFAFFLLTIETYNVRVLWKISMLPRAMNRLASLT
jgi:hypothetical protein